MTYISYKLVIFFCFISRINLAFGQFTLSGCPTGWVFQQGTCYKFVSNGPVIYEEADSTCWSYGAKLLTVDDYTEHQFIIDWLLRNDVAFHSIWFTSGMYANDKLIWQGDATNDYDDVINWITPPTPSSIYSKVSYQFSVGNSRTGSYGWKLAAPSHPANFICEIPQADSHPIGMATRDFGYGVGFVNPETLPHGPEMIEEPIGIVVFGTGQTIFLECDSHGIPLPKYTWYKGTNDKQEITPKSNLRYTLSGGRLTIETPKETEDGGFYRCYTYNEFGGIYSTTVQIVFGYLHSFPPVKPDDQWGTEFEGVRISCLGPAYNPAVKYAWFKNHDTHNHVFSGHPYHFVSQSGYLYFSEVQFTDDRTYYCVVTLDNPDYMVADSSLAPSKVSLGCKLHIRPGKNYGNYGPIIHTHVFPSPAIRGSTIRLECIAFGSLPLKYKWRREDGRPFVKGTRVEARARVLTIPNAPLEAEGNYICTVTRPGASRSATIVLVMEAKPYFSNHIKNILADPGQKVTWYCKAIARPAATYSWFKNGKLITNTPGKFEVQGNILTIYNTQKDTDEGMYQCAASNQHGTAYSSAQLKVISFAPNFNRFPMQTSVLGPLGGNRTIECQIEGAPLPVVRWIKDGRDLNLVPGMLDGHVGMTAKHSLVITQIQTSDQGLYTCEASNDLGKAANSTFMTVVPGIVIDRVPESQTVIVNRTAFFYCTAAYDNLHMDITYEWQFNGHLIQTGSRYILGEQNGVGGLYIREAQYTNRGEYKCVARTTLHSDAKSAFLDVRGPPGPPAGVYVDDLTVTPTSVQIIWTVGVDSSHGSPILYYDIEAETNYNRSVWHVIASDIPETRTATDATNLGHRPDQRTVLVSGLIPHTSYRFRVRAVNDLGRGVEASRPCSAVKTPATAPVIPPQNVGGGDGSVGTLNISWTPLPVSEHCGSGIGYRVYWKKKGNPDRDWQTQVIKENVGGYTALVGVDNYYLQYEVIVQAFNDNGDGPNSTLTTVYSAMGLPNAVPKITGWAGINLTTVIVYFDPIPNDREHVKGRISGYTIEYYWNNVGCNPTKSFNCPLGLISNRNVWGQVNQVMLIDLQLNSEYFFRMFVFNSAGTGPKGEWQRGETATYAPLNYPRFVTVKSVDQHSVLITWRQIQTTNNEEIITGYKVKWWEVQSDIRSANESTCLREKNSLTIRGLQTQTVYQLRVQGTSAGGDGQMSNAVFFTIEGGRLPVDPGTTQICYEGQPCASSSRNLQISFLTLLFTYLLNAWFKFMIT